MIKSLNVLLRQSASTTILRACLWKLTGYPAGGFWRGTVPRSFFCCTSKLFKADEDPVEYPLEVCKIRNFFTVGREIAFKNSRPTFQNIPPYWRVREMSVVTLFEQNHNWLFFVPKVLFHVILCWDHVEYRVRRESRKNECWRKRG